MNREELEQKAAEGYYAIPGYQWDQILYPEGHFCPEEDLSICPEGWSIAVSGSPEENGIPKRCLCAKKSMHL